MAKRFDGKPWWQVKDELIQKAWSEQAKAEIDVAWNMGCRAVWLSRAEEDYFRKQGLGNWLSDNYAWVTSDGYMTTVYFAVKANINKQPIKTGPKLADVYRPLVDAVSDNQAILAGKLKLMACWYAQAIHAFAKYKVKDPNEKEKVKAFGDAVIKYIENMRNASEIIDKFKPLLEDKSLITNEQYLAALLKLLKFGPKGQMMANKIIESIEGGK